MNFDSKRASFLTALLKLTNRGTLGVFLAPKIVGQVFLNA